MTENELPMNDISTHPRFRQGAVIKLRRELSNCLLETRRLALQQLDVVHATLQGLVSRGLIDPQPGLAEQIDGLKSVVLQIDGHVSTPEEIDRSYRQLDGASRALAGLLTVLSNGALVHAGSKLRTS